MSEDTELPDFPPYFDTEGNEGDVTSEVYDLPTDLEGGEDEQSD